MYSPLVTIGLTCFNAEETIRRAVASAFAQDWLNFELLIVDDCSSDDSVALIEELIANDQRARLIRHTCNKGPAGARNMLLQEAKGEFIVFFDDDDESLPGRVSAQIKVLTDYEKQNGKRLVACYAGGFRIYPNGYVKDLPAIGLHGQVVPHGSGLADYLLFYHKQAEWSYGSGVLNVSIECDEAGQYAVVCNFHRASHSQNELQTWLKTPIDDVRNEARRIVVEVLGLDLQVELEEGSRE